MSKKKRRSKLLRVFELGRHYGVDAKKIIFMLEKLGAPVKSHMSLVEEMYVTRIHDIFNRKMRLAMEDYADAYGLAPNQLVNMRSFKPFERPKPGEITTRQAKETKIAGSVRGIDHTGIDKGLSSIPHGLPASGMPEKNKIENELGENETHNDTDGRAEIGQAFGLTDPQDFEPTANQEELEKRTDSLQKTGISIRPYGIKKPKKATSTSSAYVRDPKVRAWVLKVTNGICECCGEPAPFKTADGRPYLEVHHIIPLAENGSDTVENAVGVCPNCHRGLHHSIDRVQKASDIAQRIARLLPS